MVLIVAILGIVLVFPRPEGTLVLRWGLLTLLAIAILFPYIRLPAGVPDVRPEFIIVLVAWGLLLLGHLAARHPIRLRHFPTYKWFLLLGVCILVSMAYAALAKGQPVIWRDFWDLFKPFLYLLTFALVANLRISAPSMKHYYKFSLIILLLSALFGFAQYIDLAGINTVISPYYAPTQMEGLLAHGRITGTTPNPNEFGALMILAISLALSGGLFLREKKLQVLSWATLPFFGLALTLTLSRSSLISAVLAATVIIAMFLKQRGLKRKFRRVIGLVLFACVVSLVVLPIIPEKVFFRYSQLAHFTEASSWQERVELWRTNFPLWIESPLLGWGVGKATMGTIVDNEWLLLLRRYGVVGVVVFLGLYGSLFLGLSCIRRFSSEPSVVALSAALQGTLVGYILYMLVAGVYHSMQLMSILLIFLGLAYSQWRLEGPAAQEALKP